MNKMPTLYYSITSDNKSVCGIFHFAKKKNHVPFQSSTLPDMHLLILKVYTLIFWVLYLLLPYMVISIF